MIKNLKKAFTIIELVIVIAVIAILAAVMIPTYSSLVDKANQSADIQAVKQMNTILATYVDGSVQNIGDAINALDKDNIDLEDYKPLQKDHYYFFYMDGKTPKVVYTDANKKAVYPEGVKTEEFELMSLSGSVPESNDYEKNDVAYTSNNVNITIDDGKELVHLMNNIDNYYAKSEVNTIKINLSGTVDLNGSSASFGKIEKNVEIICEEGTIIKGLRADSNSELGSWANEPKYYGYALFNEVPSGKTVKVENLEIKNVVVKDTSKSTIAFGHSAVLFGKVSGTVEIKGVTISDCDVYGGDKVGAVIGSLYGSATLDNVKVKNTNIYGLGYVATLIGCVDKGNVTFKNMSESNVENVKTAINVSEWSKVWFNTEDHPDKTPDKNFATNNEVKISEVDTYLNDGNTYLPWINTPEGSKRDEITGYLAAMTTNDYYWFMQAERVEFEINGTKYSESENAIYAWAYKSYNESRNNSN